MRVVENKYPALVGDFVGDGGLGAGELMQGMPALGRHEVIVEGRLHSRGVLEQSDFEMLEVMQAYRERFLAAAADPLVKHVVIFRNHGAMANASIAHPHAQLAGLDFVPPVVDRKLERSREHVRGGGRALLLDLVGAEVADGSRLIGLTDRFATFVPFAPTYEYEMWVAPRIELPGFDGVEDDALLEFGAALRRGLAAMEEALDGPDYNYILHTPPTRGAGDGVLPWYCQIIPRRVLRRASSWASASTSW